MIDRNRGGFEMGFFWDSKFPGFWRTLPLFLFQTNLFLKFKTFLDVTFKSVGLKAIFDAPELMRIRP